jgi:hypothetical protein
MGGNDDDAGWGRCGYEEKGRINNSWWIKILKRSGWV